MASLLNPYFSHGTSTLEQTLFERIKTESIKVQGRLFYYLPRNVLHEDLILGEDIISKFDLAIPVEMFMANATGFEGDKEMFTQFGLQIQNSYTLIISKSRWEAEVKTAIQNADFDVMTLSRPQEGDIIYDPLTKFLVEIKFVDHDAEFYQAGKNYMYHLNCEAFQYSSENIQTGIEEIDAFNSESEDVLDGQILTENNNIIVDENGDYVMSEVPVEPVKHTEYGTEFSNFSESIKYQVENPFGFT